MTFCPATAWKFSPPFLTEKDFQNSIYSWEEVFHPKTLEILRNGTIFSIKMTYAAYYGMCFTIEKLYDEPVMDWSKKLFMNKSLGKK